MHTKIILFFGILSTVGLSRCRTLDSNQSNAHLYEFRKLSPASRESLRDFRLDGVDGFPGSSIQYAAVNQYYFSGTGDTLPHLEVSFPSLTKSQFEHLKATYGFGLSRIKYRRGESYNLVDFLLPMMQATIDHEFEQEIQPDYTKFASNCWGTAYEVVRTSGGLQADGSDLSAGMMLFYAPTKEMQNILQSETKGRLLGRGDSIDALERHSSLLGVPFRFGDLALILSEENTLEHVLTFIDRGVWFEKVGLGGGAPYRLITTADFYHRVENGRRVEWRRFNRGSFPHPAEVFKSIRQLAPVPGTDRTMILDPPLDGPLSFRQIHFLFDDMGRARLSEAAYREVNPRP